MTDTLRNKCELFERNRAAISQKFMFEKDLMSIAAGLIFTGADKEADVDKLKECRSILGKHTGVFSEYRDAVKLALLSEMALADDPEQYIEDVKAVYKKLHKGHFRDNSYMVLAAMLLCDLGRQKDADSVVDRHNEILQRMDKLHPILTDSSDISYVILLALSDRSVDAIIYRYVTQRYYHICLCSKNKRFLISNPHHNKSGRLHTVSRFCSIHALTLPFRRFRQIRYSSIVIPVISSVSSKAIPHKGQCVRCAADFSSDCLMTTTRYCMYR